MWLPCQAQHWGRREYLYDDLQNVRLDLSLVAEPPLELWPEIIARTEIPSDVQKEFIAGRSSFIEFYPGYARTFTNIGRERGWGPVTGRQFEVLLGPDGALLVGDVKIVAEKIARFDQQLGGIDRLTLQMSVADLSHERTLNAIELIGQKLIPGIRGPERQKAL